MDIHVTITHTFSTEVFELFKNLFSGGQPGGNATLADTVETKSTKKEGALRPINGQKIETVKTSDSGTDNVDVTLETVRKASEEKAKAGKRTEVKALVASFGVPNITAIKKEDYPKFLTAVNAL